MSAFAAIVVAAAAAGPVMGPARYEPGLRAVVVPYQGSPPRSRGSLTADPPAFRLDFEAPSGFGGPRAGEVRDHPVLVGWSAAPLDGDRVRVTLRLRSPAAVEVRHDPVRRRYLLVPAAAPAAPPAPAPVDAPAPAPSPSPSPSPSPPPRPVATALPAPATVALEGFFPAYEERFAPGGLVASVSAMPTLGVTGAATLPVPGWLAGSPLDAPWLAPGLQAEARLTHLAYAFQDRELPVSVHLRDEWRLEAQALRGLAIGQARYEAGLGYLLRYEGGTHSAAPAAPTYRFSSFRALHGPQLVGRAEWRFEGDQALVIGGLDGWRLAVSGAAMPVVFAHLDPGLPGLPYLAGYQAEAIVRRAAGPAVVGLGLRRWHLFGAGYGEAFMGPVLTAVWGVRPPD